MGDRANIVIRQETTNATDVWFYTHWCGSTIEDVTKRALAKRWRWNDPSYLARIIFDELTKGNHGSETGFGISCTIQDNQYPILVVDIPKQQVYLVQESELLSNKLPNEPKREKVRSFKEFIS